MWAARFNGNAEVLVTGVDKGAEYINFLLARPNKETSVYEIICGFAIDSCNAVLNSNETDEGFQVTAAINEAVGLGGKLRKSNDKRKNLRDAFRNAVNRAIMYLEKYDKPLAL